MNNVFGGANQVPAGSQDTSEWAVIADKLSINHEFLPRRDVYPTTDLPPVLWTELTSKIAILKS
jgi:hypothetical protein